MAVQKHLQARAIPRHLRRSYLSNPRARSDSVQALGSIIDTEIIEGQMLDNTSWLSGGLLVALAQESTKKWGGSLLQQSHDLFDYLRLCDVQKLLLAREEGASWKRQRDQARVKSTACVAPQAVPRTNGDYSTALGGRVVAGTTAVGQATALGGRILAFAPAITAVAFAPDATATNALTRFLR
jgi:hypothetical protein